MTIDYRPIELSGKAGEIEESGFLAQLLSDPFLQEVHRMRTEILNHRRRVRHRRVALAFALTATMAATGAYGYLVIAKKADNPSDQVAKTTPAAASIPPPPATTDARPLGQLEVLTLATESMNVNGRNVPVFGPLDSGDPSRPIYVYFAPFRVAERTYEEGRLTLKLDWTAPPSTVDEKEAKLATATDHASKVNLQPVPMRSYEIALNGGDGSPVIVRSESDGALITPSVDSTTHINIPETKPQLRKLLADGQFDRVALRVTANYDFTRVARGSISLSRVGSAVRRVFEDLRSGDTMVVDRKALDMIASRINVRISKSGKNSGLSAEKWRELQADAEKSLSLYYASLTPENLADLLSRDADLSVVWTAESGKLESRPVMIDNNVKSQDRSNEYERKGAEFLKAVQDVFRKGSYSRDSHRDLSEKVKVNGDVRVNVMSFFGGSTKLALDRSSTDISDEDIRQANEMRDYFLDDKARQEELKTKAKEKIEGDMRTTSTLAKSLYFYRLDAREIARTAAAAVEVSESLGVENVAIATEATLQMQLPDEMALLKQQISRMEDAARADRAANATKLENVAATQTALATTVREGREATANALAPLAKRVDGLDARMAGTPVQAPPITFNIILNKDQQGYTKCAFFNEGRGDSYDIPGTWGRKVTKVTVNVVVGLNELGGLQVLSPEIVDGNRVRLHINPANRDIHSYAITVNIDYVP